MRNCGWATILAAALAMPVFAQPAERLAPYVPSPQTVVDRMLELADLRPGETVYDLGCGDGRILFTAAREFRAKAVGIELSDPLVKQGREQAKKLGLENRVSIVEGDLLRADLRPADVVTVYLLTEANDQLKPLFERSLHPGARVVSHDFKIRGWKPDRVDEVIVSGRAHKIYVYVMPPHKA
jgi:cyclopropane fatty-acyl-phospholipid synthase-like methyltransferase